MTKNSVVAVDYLMQMLGEIRPFSFKITRFLNLMQIQKNGNHLFIYVYIFNQKIRDCGFKIKPDPEAVNYICGKWELNPWEVMVVGDWKDDLICGHRAGSVTCLLNNEKNGNFKSMAHLNINKLDELIVHLRNGFYVSHIEVQME